VSGAVSDFYDDFAEYQLRYLAFPNPRFREIRKRLSPLMARQPRAALDIGCGIGVMTDWLAQHIEHVIGIDISPRNIKIARELYRKPEFAVCAIPDDPLSNGSFDLITLLDVLEHLPQTAREDVFGQIGALATDDAVVAVNLPSRRFALEVPEVLQQVIDEALGADEVVALAATIGMEPLVLERYGVEVSNQYVFCAFSRTYPTDGTIDASRLVSIRDRLDYRRNRHRYRNKIERLRNL
jgi:SAM-dependent methyltransferase